MGIPRPLLLALLVLPTACSDDTSTVDAATDSRADLAPIQDGSPPPADQGREAVPPDAVPGDLPGDDGTHITCSAQLGTAAVSGSIGGQPISASTAGAVRAMAWGVAGYGVALLDQQGTCASVAQTMTDPRVWILVCDTAPGSYAVGQTCKGDGGPGVYLQNQVSIPAAGADPKATSGSITIEAFDPDCGGTVKGSFSVMFGSEPLSGSFNAVGCGTITLY